MITTKAMIAENPKNEAAAALAASDGMDF